MRVFLLGLEDLPKVLVCHPAGNAPAVAALTARVHREGAGALRVGYELEGDLPALKIPPQGPTRRGANLWQHTCFEIFVARRNMPGYHEFNFAPSGEWQAHAFSGYRAGGPLADESLVPQLEIKRSAGRLELESIINLDQLLLGDARLSIGLSAVIEDAHGCLSYWALCHPGAKPDFHHADGFTLELD